MKNKEYQLRPESSLELLSIKEMKWLKRHSQESEIHQLLRSCVLAVLNSGTSEDNVRKINKQYQNFDIQLVWRQRGVEFVLKNPPELAFVDGEIIKGIKEQISAVVRDLVYTQMMFERESCPSTTSIDDNTDKVFEILRNSKSIVAEKRPNLVVCWGGHAISDHEYKYTKEVGYQLGLREFDICTGCGTGAMKGPMKGAAISHAKQRLKNPFYLGISEPGIISSESPNTIVNHLVIMPDIEKRLEGFVRLAHAVIVFPGGAGTAEELLYLLGILSHPENKNNPFKVILTGPKSSRQYFKTLVQFIEKTLGKEMTQLFSVIIDDPEKVAQVVKKGIEEITRFRLENDESFHFNWRLKIDKEWQIPFDPNHQNMSELNLSSEQPKHELALSLRKAFSGIVAGNVKSKSMQLIDKNGPFVMKNGGEILGYLDHLLNNFIQQKRMMIDDEEYSPCYKIEC